MGAPRTYPIIEILGVPIAKLAPDGAVTEIERLHDQQEPALVAYANAHTLNLAHIDPTYRDLLGGAGIVLNDGAGVALAARLHGDRFPANLNGSDFNPRILGLAARKNWGVYFVGARPGVAERAAAALSSILPGLDVRGTRHGFLSPDETTEVVTAIRSSGASVVMVAMGNPRQEFWLRDHLAATGARLGVGVGAFFDFAAGEVARAPAWMNRTGIEWIYRLAQEPGRMWRRYVVGNPLFLARVAKERLARARSS